MDSDLKNIDVKKVCVMCGGRWTYTAADQAYVREQGWDKEPRRCKPCRANRRQFGASYRPPGDRP